MDDRDSRGGTGRNTPNLTVSGPASTEPTADRGIERISPGAAAQGTRRDHDAGRFRDRLPVGDPAATPLGTDSETAGIRQAEGSMESPATSTAAPSTREPGHPAGHARGDYERGALRWVWVGAAGVVALLFGLMVFVGVVGRTT